MLIHLGKLLTQEEISIGLNIPPLRYGRYYTHLYTHKINNTVEVVTCQGKVVVFECREPPQEEEKQNTPGT